MNRVETASGNRKCGMRPSLTRRVSLLVYAILVHRASFKGTIIAPVALFG